MTIRPYLTFDGNCREAFEFYRMVFGTDFQVFTTFGEGPDSAGFVEEKKDEVMHCTLPIGSGVLMGSDRGDSSYELIVGNNFSLSVVADSEEQCEEWFTQLARDGTINMPLQDTFWGSYFGMCADKFGVSWMVSYEKVDSEIT